MSVQTRKTQRSPKGRIGAGVCAPFLRLAAVIVVLAALGAGCIGSCESDRPETVEQRKPPQENDQPEADTNLIRNHRELANEGTELSDAQRERFADAYYKTGQDLLKKGRRAEAEPYFREAVRLWPAHARATLRLGEQLALRRQFRAAAEAYARAAKLDPDLREAVKRRRVRLARYCLAIADQRLADSRIAGAREVLEFIQAFLDDVGGTDARERLAQLGPLLRAEAALNEARDDLQRLRKDKAYKKLREVAAEYPRTYFGQEANRLLEENGQKIILDETATGFALPPKWRHISTEHFEIYYERQTGLAGAKRYGEEAYARIVSDFGMDDAEWKTRVTMYLFSDRESWHEFLRMNRDKTMEWAGGFALPSENEICLYVTDRKVNLYKEVLPHELTHVLHYRYVGGIVQPLWLMEGLAVSQEKGGVKEARKAIDDLVRHGDAFSLHDLFKLEYYPPHAISLFYAQSATVVGFMIDEYGVELFKQFMFAFASAESTEEAIEQVYGISLDTFEEKWEKYVR